LPFFLAQVHVKGLDTPLDPCAAILVLIVTALLSLGIKEVLALSLQLVLEFFFCSPSFQLCRIMNGVQMTYMNLGGVDSTI
jgi:hypothetical protein